jgi:hypothetical protein
MIGEGDGRGSGSEGETSDIGRPGRRDFEKEDECGGET